VDFGRSTVFTEERFGKGGASGKKGDHFRYVEKEPTRRGKKTFKKGGGGRGRGVKISHDQEGILTPGIGISIFSGKEKGR